MPATESFAPVRSEQIHEYRQIDVSTGEMKVILAAAADECSALTTPAVLFLWRPESPGRALDADNGTCSGVGGRGMLCEHDHYSVNGKQYVMVSRRKGSPYNARSR